MTMAQKQSAKPMKAPIKKATSQSQPASKKERAAHPKYRDMILEAIKTLDNPRTKHGVSRIAIFNHIKANYALGDNDNVINSHLKKELLAGISDGNLTNTTASGARGSFKIGKKEKAAQVKAPTPKAEKGQGDVPKKKSVSKKKETPSKAASKEIAPTKRTRAPAKKAKLAETNVTKAQKAEQKHTSTKRTQPVAVSKPVTTARMKTTGTTVAPKSAVKKTSGKRAVRKEGVKA
uniref:H15 domain-containing protein n=1 Tax=Acrobeloides nanus TaxID=290746 RepID=A0A914E3A9_9BILA